MLAELVALVVPSRCAGCGAPSRHATDIICAACRRALPWLDLLPCCPRCALPLPCGRRCPARAAAFDAAWSAVAYEGVARELMHALKFSAARPLADLMAAQIAANAPRDLLAPGATIVAVPAHPRRRRARGFDPAELIAAALAHRTGLPVVRALRRDRAPSRQLGASRDMRRDPSSLAFHARTRITAPDRVVLVDDIHTTGATLHACAGALHDAGSSAITAITWARTLDDHPR